MGKQVSKIEYDVFISYSRSDYENADKTIISNNPILKIKEAFTRNNITYWFDEEGCYSGEKFVSVITDAIEKSSIFLFVSSSSSNQSRWTEGEVMIAIEEKKRIIPLRIDDSAYNKTFKLLLAPIDYIDYKSNHDVGIQKLVASVLQYKNEREKEVREMEQALRQRNERIRLEQERKEKLSTINDKLVDFELSIRSAYQKYEEIRIVVRSLMDEKTENNIFQRLKFSLSIFPLLDTTENEILKKQLSDKDAIINCLMLDKNKLERKLNDIIDERRVEYSNHNPSFTDRCDNWLYLLPAILCILFSVVGFVSEMCESSLAKYFWLIGLLCSLALIIIAVINKRLLAFVKHKKIVYFTFAGIMLVLCTVKCVVEAKQIIPYDIVNVFNRDSDNVRYVDLGLPSGTLWADRNVGANDVQDYGGFYSWGEINNKSEHSKSNYSYLESYDIVGTSYDVAGKNLGDGWQMPTKWQFNELKKECEWKWENNGYKITGKNHNSIFLPAAGAFINTEITSRDYYGFYWTGHRYNHDYAESITFSCVDGEIENINPLFYGLAVRAVKLQK